VYINESPKTARKSFSADTHCPVYASCGGEPFRSGTGMLIVKARNTEEYEQR
jgi:hypothetical protein